METLNCYIGIDLGSTTTKAVFLDENEEIMGRGITNSRSNYDVACQVASEDAEINSRFVILRRRVEADPMFKGELSQGVSLASHLVAWLECKYKLAQHNAQLHALKEICFADPAVFGQQKIKPLLEEILCKLYAEALDLFQPNVTSRSDFFRDIAASGYMNAVEAFSRDDSSLFDKLIGVYDRAILKVECRSYAGSFSEYMGFSADEVAKEGEFAPYADAIKALANEVADLVFQPLNTIGTGYGRQRLPFPKEQIRSEILCHGLGAHQMFPNTRTVLDIGGQDTKAIQIDDSGIVTNFQMNDRCAAGCGRYLGYIADEMNMGVHELGPMAMKSKKQVKINSTCTVFAGTELRERLSMGEKREDILAGLHRAMILRAMSLLARSGGIDDEFTFTGGVAKNQAAVKALKQLIVENYGERILNISSDSIYTGALGAALFAKRDGAGVMADFDLKKVKKKVKTVKQIGGQA